MNNNDSQPVHCHDGRKHSEAPQRNAWGLRPYLVRPPEVRAGTQKAWLGKASRLREQDNLFHARLMVMRIIEVDTRHNDEAFTNWLGPTAENPGHTELQPWV
jgi:hypothetical protein